jgi:hypothetical protein
MFMRAVFSTRGMSARKTTTWAKVEIQPARMRIEHEGHIPGGNKIYNLLTIA